MGHSQIWDTAIYQAKGSSNYGLENSHLRIRYVGLRLNGLLLGVVKVWSRSPKWDTPRPIWDSC